MTTTAAERNFYVREISFGKHAFNGSRKENAYTVQLKLSYEDGKGYVFTCSGNIWNRLHTDMLCGGQCLDTMLPALKDNALFVEIYRLWKLYHLNDMHAGTREQENAIKDWESKGNEYEYTAVCDYLKSINMYEVEHNGEPYRYGTAWLYEEIPMDDLCKIVAILNPDND